MTTTPTIDFDIETIEYKNMLHITMWDIGGQITLWGAMGRIWRQYFVNIHALIFVIDANNRYAPPLSISFSLSFSLFLYLLFFSYDTDDLIVVIDCNDRYTSPLIFVFLYLLLSSFGDRTSRSMVSSLSLAPK